MTEYRAIITFPNAKDHATLDCEGVTMFTDILYGIEYYHPIAAIYCYRKEKRSYVPMGIFKGGRIK